MKRQVLLAAVLVFSLGLVPTVHAQEDGGGPGCGVGSVIWDGRVGVFPQLFAVTTNMSFTQTLSMTFGTSGCARDGIVLAPYERQQFAAANLPQLLQDMARGSGETLQSLADMMAISPADRARFYEVSRARLAVLVTTVQQDANKLLAALDQVVIDARIRQVPQEVQP